MRPYLKLSATIFGLLAAGQLVRLIRRWPVRVDGLDVPLWLSAVVAVLAVGLAIWGFRLASATPVLAGPVRDRAG